MQMKPLHAKLLIWPPTFLIFLWLSGYGEPLMTKIRMSNVPESLHSASLQDRRWSAAERPTAIWVTHKQLLSIADATGRAAEKGDVALASVAAAEITKVLRAWNEQDEATRQAGRPCVLAAVAISQGIDEAVAGQPWFGRGKFEANIKDCKP